MGSNIEILEEKKGKRPLSISDEDKVLQTNQLWNQFGENETLLSITEKAAIQTYKRLL